MITFGGLEIERKNKKEKQMIPVMVFNSVAVICFSVLAYVFNKWWIVLFSLLIVMNYKRTNSNEEGDEE